MSNARDGKRQKAMAAQTGLESEQPSKRACVIRLRVVPACITCNEQTSCKRQGGWEFLGLCASEKGGKSEDMKSW